LGKFHDPDHAIEFEKQVKGWSRKKKEAIIAGNWEKLKELSVCNNESHFSNAGFDSLPTGRQALSLTERSTPLSLTKIKYETLPPYCRCCC
jgi:hypothetical protein